MSQDQRQDTLTDAAETDEKKPTWEIDVYSVICHDAPGRAQTSRPPSDGRQGRQRINRIPAPPANRSDIVDWLKVACGPNGAAFQHNLSPAFVLWRAKSVVFAGGA
jgi:hypothetical protein